MVKVAAVQFGMREAAANMRKLGDDAMYKMDEALMRVAEDMMEVEERVFTSEGRRAGGAWRRPTAAWQRRKEMGWTKLSGEQVPPGDPRIGHWRRRLRRSLTYRGNPDMILEINGRQGTLRFGSKVPYAHTQQQHRPIFKFTQGDRKRWAHWISRTVVKEWKGRARKRRG